MQTPSNPFDQQKPITGVKKILLVSSGKGGVGKSTVATNLAIALSKKAKVGLLDADIYGPSIPRMMGSLHQKPEVTQDNKIIPLQRFGIKLMSIGFLVDENAAVVWRGPMLFKAIDQFFKDIAWGELDYLVIDLPPGTGDVQLSIVQKVPVTATICVTTPQNVALADVKKAIDMFERVKIPVLGVVENMAYMLNPTTQEKIQLFPKGELYQYLDSKKIPHIVEIPFHPNVSQGGEIGIPITEGAPSCSESLAFKKLADYVLEHT